MSRRGGGLAEMDAGTDLLHARVPARTRCAPGPVAVSPDGGTYTLAAPFDAWAPVRRRWSRAW